jgi:hypothetical protein
MMIYLYETSVFLIQLYLLLNMQLVDPQYQQLLETR